MKKKTIKLFLGVVISLTVILNLTIDKNYPSQNFNLDHFTMIAMADGENSEGTDPIIEPNSSTWVDILLKSLGF